MALKTRSLKYTKNKLAKAQNQVSILEEEILNGDEALPSFATKLDTYGMMPFKPNKLEILQINLGYMCNLSCDHCHVDAGPDRTEMMTRETLDACLLAIDESGANTVDLTGGAPEMHPDFCWFVEELSKRNVSTIVRSNLTILVSNKKYRTYPEFFKKHKVIVTASLPCYTKENVDKQRGNGVFNDSIEALILLNKLGYGVEGSGLELNLVFNPGGANLPPAQAQLELDYKKELKEHFDLVFNNLYTITNLPLSRFLDYLINIGKYEEYMVKLVNAFNPSAAQNVMCKNTLSVSWEGKLFDCDFNQMLELPIKHDSILNIKDFSAKSLQERNIVLNNHCYGCTAGAGSSCQGTVA